MKLKQKDLKDLANKINEIAELEGEDQIDPSQSYDDLYQDLVNAVAGSEDTENNEPEVEILEDDKEDFTENQWNILAELGCPAAGGESEEEEEEGSDEEDETEEEEEPDDDDEEEEGEDEDEEDEPEEEEDEVPSEDEIKSMKKKDLKQVVEDHELQVDTSQKLDALRDEVIDALHGSEEEEEEEEEPEEEEEAEEGVTYEDLQKMTKKKDLKTVIEEYELDVDASDYKKVDDLREAIAEALELVEPEEDEEEEEPEEEEAEVPAYDEIMAMAKKSLKQVIEEHELDIDPDDHKKAELQKVVAKALGYEVEEKESKQKSGSKEKGSKKGEKKESKVKKIAELLLEKDGKSTPRELVEEAENRGLSPSTMRSALSHCKKEDQLERYHMPEVIVKDEDTGIIMLKSTYDNKKKKSSASKGKKDTSKSSSKGSSKGTKKGKE